MSSLKGAHKATTYNAFSFHSTYLKLFKVASNPLNGNVLNFLFCFVLFFCFKLKHFERERSVELYGFLRFVRIRIQLVYQIN